MHLGQDASDAPQVDAAVVGVSDDHLRRPIGPTLYVRGEMVGREATAAEIDQFDFAARKAFDDDVFWFDVAMDQIQTVDKLQSLQYLPRDELQSGNREIGDLIVFSDKPPELVQIVSKQF